ncbi:MAG: GDP-L-fucose synthase [Bacteroidales bacterium]|nr:GDP-L-fucose synthase [Bacteroidales bacterium]
MTTNDTVYVAGHCGLVGSAIWRRLEAKGYTKLVGRSHAELDLCDAAAVRQFFDEQRPDCVILAAAYVGGIVANNEQGADFIYRNLQIQQNVIGEAFRHEVRKLLFLGSTCIYPRLAPQPMTEESLLTGSLEPTNEPYALAKIAGLKMCEAFNRQYGTNYIAVMPTNLYGPRDNFDLLRSHVLPGMMRKLHLARLLQEENLHALRADLTRRPVARVASLDTLQGIADGLATYGIGPDDLHLWGTGRPLREFMWSDDMADACLFMMEQVEAQELATQGVSFVNVGTGEEISIRNLADLVSQTVGYRGNIRFDSTKPDGTPRKLTDLTRLHNLGWHHTTSLEQGVEKLYDWYRDDLGL